MGIIGDDKIGRISAEKEEKEEEKEDEEKGRERVEGRRRGN